MFLGTYEHAIDDKNRIRIPPKFRKEMQDGMVVSKGNDGCLFLLPKNQFEHVLIKTENVPMFDSSAQLPLRALFSSACEVEEDSQGRFLLPANLKSFANINKEIVFVGVGFRVEIWAKERWMEYSSNASKNFDNILEGLKNYGI